MRVKTHQNELNADPELLPLTKIYLSRVLSDYGVLCDLNTSMTFPEAKTIDVAKNGIGQFTSGIQAFAQAYKLAKELKGQPHYDARLADVGGAVHDAFRKAFIHMSFNNRDDFKALFIKEMKRLYKEVVQGTDQTVAKNVKGEIDKYERHCQTRKVESYKRLGPAVKKLVDQKQTASSLEAISSLSADIQEFLPSDPGCMTEGLYTIYQGLTAECMRSLNASVSVQAIHRLKDFEDRLS